MKPIWVDKLENAVKLSNCRSDVLRLLDLSTVGSGNHRTVSRWITKLNLDCSHFDYRKVISDKKRGKKLSKLDDIDVLVENSPHSSGVVKRVFRERSIYECSECNISNVYNNKPITLQLDHINGIHNDNQLINLRWLCPNCHTQTDTYGSKRLKIPKLESTRFKSRTRRTGPRISRRKVERPSKEHLKELLDIHKNWTYIGKKYGVSDNAVRKWARSYTLI